MQAIFNNVVHSFNPTHFTQDYKSKSISMDRAALLVHSGDNVFVSGNAASPTEFLRQLAKRKDELKDVSIFHLLLLGEDPLADDSMRGHIHHAAFFVGHAEREAVIKGRADYIPIFLSEIPAVITSGVKIMNVVFVMVSPPDEYGYMSLGVECAASKAAVDYGKTIVVQVNEFMPRTHGDTFIHISDVDYIVEHSEHLVELEIPEFTDVEHRIAQHIAPLIEDGATLQLGIGGIPNAVLSELDGKKDLGIHTEMVSDGVLLAIEKGIVTNARKNFHPKKAVATFVLGTRRLYEFVNDNPMFEFLPADYTNNPFNIAQNEKMISINSAIEIDITGQVCADSMGPLIYSGFGGQLDFVRGASASKGGKAIIALPSTAKNGTVSRIVMYLKHGSGVVTTRGDVRYVVTEYGVASLFGKNLRERAKALISIAHPDFREELEKDVRIRFGTP
ncbi:MAG: acetyl-CoA hydrolase/transferase C-terminal domain-containing protein [Bacteroidota bacterium]|nr:acetyl-CoA hydrolase/transferase C-terminal domain-containing protein [Bacteroidota bacterium]